MKIDYKDFEAIAVLDFGTLEDFAFESARHFALIDNILIEGQCYGEVQEALVKMTHPTS